MLLNLLVLSGTLLGSPTDTPPDGATAPDPSDPTRTDARLGAGYKYTGYTGGPHMNEVRLKAGLITGSKGIFIADIGVGSLQGAGESNDSGLTDGRFRYFGLGQMDRSKAYGYRGVGGSVELQTQGQVRGTDGSNSLALGALLAYGAGETLSFYPNLIGAGVWSKDLDDYLGLTLRADLIASWKPEFGWPGSYLKLRPSYSHGVTDELEGSGDFYVEAALGGSLTEDRRWWWDLQWRKFYVDDLEDQTRGSNSELTPDWSLFFSVTLFT